MALEIQNGKAVLFGITNSGSPITMSGYASFILQDGKLTHNFKLTAVEDENEADTALIGTNEHIEETITWTPAGATRQAAADTTALPAPLQKITMSNFKVPLLNGDWIYVGGGTIDVNHAVGKMSLKLRKYVDDTQNALLTTTVQG
jgi:hypothetical protein